METAYVLCAHFNFERISRAVNSVCIEFLVYNLNKNVSLSGTRRTLIWSAVFFFNLGVGFVRAFAASDCRSGGRA